VGSSRTTASFRAHSPTVAWGPPGTAMWMSAPKWSSKVCRGIICFTMAFTWATGACLLEQLIRLLLLSPWCLQGCFTCFLTCLSQLPGSFLPFPTQAEWFWWVHWSWLEPTVSGMGKPHPVLARGCPRTPLSACGHLNLLH